MFAGVEKFASKNPSSSVADVRFVVFPSDIETALAFKAAASKQRGTGMHNPENNSIVRESFIFTTAVLKVLTTWMPHARRLFPRFITCILTTFRNLKIMRISHP